MWPRIVGIFTLFQAISLRVGDVYCAERHHTKSAVVLLSLQITATFLTCKIVLKTDRHYSVCVNHGNDPNRIRNHMSLAINRYRYFSWNKVPWGKPEGGGGALPSLLCSAETLASILFPHLRLSGTSNLMRSAYFLVGNTWSYSTGNFVHLFKKDFQDSIFD